MLRQSVLETGSAVGDLAMGLFGAFTEVPYGELPQMIQTTEKLLAAGTETVAEASFSYRGCFCSVDILCNLGEKRVELYEVKSSTGVHDIYLHDVAYQVWVLTKLGYRVEKACLVHIDSTYVRHGALELHRLFRSLMTPNPFSRSFSSILCTISSRREGS